MLDRPWPDIEHRVAAWALFALVLLFAVHGLWAHLLSVKDLARSLRRRVAVVVADSHAGLNERLAQNPVRPIEIVGVYNERPPTAAVAHSGPPLDGTLEDLVIRTGRSDIDTIVLAIPMTETDRIARICVALESVVPDIYVTADIGTTGFSGIDLQTIGRVPVVRLRRRPLDDWQQVQKAMFDRIFGAMLLVCLSPALLLIAVAIRLDSEGPVLFRQPRLGFNNRPFMVYKFRSMFHHNDPAGLNGARQARRGDPRITRIGRLLRKTSIDELPQLLNVLKGEMSLVGPRPHPLNTRVGDRLFQDVVANYAARHRVLPGITGWAQVNGWRGETVVPEQIEQRVAHDLYYIEHWSLGFDLRILLLTVTREILSKSAF